MADSLKPPKGLSYVVQLHGTIPFAQSYVVGYIFMWI